MDAIVKPVEQHLMIGMIGEKIMNRDEWLESLSKKELIMMLKNIEYQRDLAQDKVQYLTGCPIFGESDGMNAMCVDCSYECHGLWEKCHPFNTIFSPWHCEKEKQRKKFEENKNYKRLEEF